MKNKILETEITSAAEHLAQVLRSYSGRPMRCDLTIRTREGEKDKYFIVAYYSDETDENALTEGGRIYYEDGTDKIAKIEPFYGEVKNDTPGQTREELPQSR